MSDTSRRLLIGHHAVGKGAVIALFAAGVFLALIGGLMAAILPWWFILMLSVLPALALKIILNRNQKNLGLINHVNKLFEVSSGDLMVVAAGDDISLSDRVECLVDAFNQSGKKATDVADLVIPMYGAMLYQSINWYRKTA